MDAAQRIKQEQACHIRFKQLQREGTIPAAFTVYDYARQITGEAVDSLKVLKDWELNALRDRLEGKPNKGLDKLSELAAAAGIEDLDGWIRRAAASGAFAYLRGHTAETLPLRLQWQLGRCLSTRQKQPPKMKRPEPTLF